MAAPSPELAPPAHLKMPHGLGKRATQVRCAERIQGAPAHLERPAVVVRAAMRFRSANNQLELGLWRKPAGDLRCAGIGQIREPRRALAAYLKTTAGLGIRALPAKVRRRAGGLT
jgi:hypothetical protein